MNKSSSGCWICRLRRKKCDEQRPICRECLSLCIHNTCSYGSKPVWMDGDVKQTAMAEQIRIKIKQYAPYRRSGKWALAGIDNVSIGEKKHESEAKSQNDRHGPRLSDQPGTPSLSTKDLCEKVQQMRPFAQSDSVLLMFYLERVFPSIFPFYHPPSIQGGRAWILDLAIGSPVFRQTILSQSSYFFAIAHESSTVSSNPLWEALLQQTKNAFDMLRNSIEIIQSYDGNEHILGSVRAMTAILQLQRFDVAITCFDNCQAHLDAALTLFGKIIDVVGATNLTSSSNTFQIILNLLGSPVWILPGQQVEIFSSEQAAFQFSAGLILFDDIIASTALQRQPQLYQYHQTLLHQCDGPNNKPPIDLRATMGCENWVLFQIGEISSLSAWKKNSEIAGSLHISKLAGLTASINETLEKYLSSLENEVPLLSQENSFSDNSYQMDEFCKEDVRITRQSLLVTRIWAHSAFLYLSIVVSGWQPANCDVRHHVNQALELLSHQISPPSLLRTMAWPLCVVGFLAGTPEQGKIREMITSLQPASHFRALRRGLEIVERVWDDRATGKCSDFASYFRDNDSIVLLV